MDDLDQTIAALDWLVVAALRHRFAVAAVMDLAPRDLLALDALRRDPGLSPGVLGRLLMLTPGGTTGTLHRLRDAGFIRRTSAAANHLDVRLWLTQAGRTAAGTGPISLSDIIRAGTTDDAIFEAPVNEWIRKIADDVDQNTVALIQRGAETRRGRLALPARVRWG